MNFSRFFNYLILFFLFATLVTNARPSSSTTPFPHFGQPLFFEIKRIPDTSPSPFKTIIVDKQNRLFITNEHSVFIYDGENHQRIDVPGYPIVATNGNGAIAIGANKYLLLLTSNQTGQYSTKQLIDSSSLGIEGQITSIGLGDDESIYFSTNSKLWRVGEKPIQIDSSANTINLYHTLKGLVFLSDERGFFRIENNHFITLGKINNLENSSVLKVVATNNEFIAITKDYPWIHSIEGKNQTQYQFASQSLASDEKITNVFYSNSYLFLSTSRSGLLMIDSLGHYVNRIENFGNFSSELLQDIYTSDGINFFLLTPTQIWRFLDPSLYQVFDYRNGLKGKVNSLFFYNKYLYVATSNGLYQNYSSEDEKIFKNIKDGEFTDFVVYKDYLYTTSKNGLYSINGNQVNKITGTFSFDKVCLIKTVTPKAAFLDHHKIYTSELVSPIVLKEIINTSGLKFNDIFSIDSLLFIKTLDSRIYYLNLNNEHSSIVECNINRNISSNPLNLVSIFSDTFYIINDRIYRTNRLDKNNKQYKVVGRSASGEPILNNILEFQPDYQALTISSHKSNPITLPSYLQVNFALIDHDSTTWIATSDGLINISAYYLNKRWAQLYPKMFFYSISSAKSNFKHSFYKGFIADKNNSRSDFSVKYGSTLDIALGGNGNFEWSEIAFSVKLDGYQDEWTSWSTNRSYTFSNLKPGKYILRAKARDFSGLESTESILTVYFIPNFLQTPFALILFSFLLAFAIYALYRWRSYNHALEKFKLESIINRRTDELVKEKEKTDNLLARVLPRETATELKETGKVNTQKFNVVTVLFSDIQGFTKITDETNPESLIDQLDKFFLYFDAVVEKYKIEKIKTIGDAYMCAGGIPQKNRTNPVEVVLAALEMLHFMKEINKQHNPGQNIWDLRIGIDTGPVIAGVVGRNKLSYDIWGTTVNTASRMESSGEVGKINISWNTYLLVQDYFLCTYRGKMPIKNKGDIQMYFVNGIKPSLLDNLESVRPNREFEIQLQILRLGDLEEFILEKLEKGLPKNLYYHNLKHTVDVYTEVELIGRAENVTMEELLILRTAALLHDAGHMIDYDTHEEMGVKLAREILPDYQYTERQIEIISELILVTKLPPRPKNLLEAIICDSDLDYLGRTDFIPVSNTLYKELHEHGKIGSQHEWNELQIKFIEKHQYFTNTARRLRNVNKNSQLENIKTWMGKNKL